MRIVLGPIGPRHDLNCMLALGKVLQGRGHWVTFCAPEEFRKLVYDNEFQMVSCGFTYREYLEGINRERDHSGELARKLSEDVAMHFVSLRDSLREADILVGSLFQLAGPSIAEQFGVTYFHAVFSPVLLEPEQFPALGVLTEKASGLTASLRRSNRKREWDKRVLNSLNREREYCHLPPVKDLYKYLFRSKHTLVALDPDLFGLKDDQAQIATGFWCSEGGSLDAELEEYFSAGPRPVYIGYLNLQREEIPVFLKLVTEALLSSGHRIVLGPDWSVSPVDLPQGCRLMDSYEFASLFPHMAAVFHRGDHETAAHAIRSGVPQVILPSMLDQYMWAERVHSLGLSPEPLKDTDPRVVTKAILQVISDVKIREQASKTGEKVRSRNGLNFAADTIERLVPTIS